MDAVDIGARDDHPVIQRALQFVEHLPDRPEDSLPLRPIRMLCQLGRGKWPIVAHSLKRWLEQRIVFQRLRPGESNSCFGATLRCENPGTPLTLCGYGFSRFQRHYQKHNQSREMAGVIRTMAAPGRRPPISSLCGRPVRSRTRFLLWSRVFSICTTKWMRQDAWPSTILMAS